MNDISDLISRKSVTDVLFHWSGVQPDKTAYLFLKDDGEHDGEVTFAGLYRRVVHLARRLEQERLANQRILIILPSGLDYVAGFLACLAAGAIAVPLYPPRGKRDWQRLSSVATDCTPAALLLSREVEARYGGEFEALRPLGRCRRLSVEELAGGLGNAGSTSDAESALPAPAAIDPSRIAFLQYTSGSTGDAKGVMVSHGNLLHNARQQALCMGNGNRSIDVSWLPLYHDMGLIGKILQSLSVGAQSIFMSPYAFLRHPLRWLDAISTYRGTFAGAPNFAYDLCVDKIRPGDIDRLDLSCWRTAYNGSEPVREATLERFYQTFRRAGFRKEAFLPCYGLAEATLVVSGGPLGGLPEELKIDRAALQSGRAVPVLPESEAAVAPVSCVSMDRPFHDQTLRIVEPDRWIVQAERRVGEIWIKSPSVARGYWNRPAETARTFHAYTTDSGEGPFLRTGDLGFLDAGKLYITGRCKELILLRGVNHYPQDIEETVQSLSDTCRTHAGAAFAYDDEKLAIVQGINRVKATRVELRDLIAGIRRLVWQVHGIAPSFVGLVHPGEIGKTSSGKIQRRLIRQRFLAGELPLLAAWRQEEEAGTKDPAEDRAEDCAAPAIEPAPAEKSPARPEDAAPSAAPPLSPLLGEKLDWLGEYCRTRVNSFVIDERRTFPPYLVLDLGNQGLLGMIAGPEYGGLGFGAREFLAVLDRLGSKDMTLALFVGLNNALGLRPILRFADRAVKDRYLPRLARGRELAAFALTEPGAGSNPQALQATARAEGGIYRLRGTKYWSGSAAWSGVMNVFARAFDEQGRAIGVSAFVVPQDAPGVRQGPEALTMGMRGMIQNAVFFEDVAVEGSHLLGRPGHGMGVAQDTMCYGRIVIAAIALGALRLCYQTMLKYAEGRDIATGRLLDNPHTRTVLGDTMHGIEAISALLEKVAGDLDRGEAVAPEILAVCKCMSTELLWRAVDRTLQMAGGRGYIESNFIPQLFRDARIFRIFEGPTETLHHFIGSSVLAGRREVRAYLQAHLGEKATVRQYDRVLGGLDGGAGLAEDPAFRHWRYQAVGDYVGWLVLRAAAAPAVASPLERFLSRRVEEAEKRLAAKLARFGDLAPVTDLRRFGQRLEAAIGRREQVSPGPETRLDAYLRAPDDGPCASESEVAPVVPPEPAPVLAQVQVPPSSPALVAPVPFTGSAPAVSARPGVAEVRAFIVRWIAGKSGRPVAAITRDVEFAALGMGSIESIELCADLSNRFALDLDPTAFWNYPTAQALADFVLSEIEARDPGRAAGAAP